MFRIIVEADYALYTRPECKVERVTYPVPTPSALEGMLKAVFWKPAIRYVIDKIVVFNPIRYTAKRSQGQDLAYRRQAADEGRRRRPERLHKRRNQSKSESFAQRGEIRCGISFRDDGDLQRRDCGDACEVCRDDSPKIQKGAIFFRAFPRLS